MTTETRERSAAESAALWSRWEKEARENGTYPEFREKKNKSQLEWYYKNKDRPDVKAYTTAYNKAYWAENKEKSKAAVRKWVGENRERHRATVRAWYHRNAEKISARRKELREKKKAELACQHSTSIGTNASASPRL